MKIMREAVLAKKVPSALLELLGTSQADINTEVPLKNGSVAGCVVVAAGKTFVVEVTGSVGAASVATAASKAKELAARFRPGAVPVLAVPFMGELGRRLCQEAGVAWLDLSGNAHIVTPGIRVIIEGRPNRFLAVGRPPNLFAPKSSRVVRWLLINHLASGGPLMQRQIARATDMAEGFVSRIVARLEGEGFVGRRQVPPGASAVDAAYRRSAEGIVPDKPGLLLDAWREAYRFSGHTILRGHVAARSGEALLGQVVEALAGREGGYAVTGLAAAWALARFAAFRTVTAYLPAEPPQEFLERIGWREEPAGANLWLVVPNDAGVFHGALEKDGIRCVHPVQAYVDLKDQPERAVEAADNLRAGLLAGVDRV